MASFNAALRPCPALSVHALLGGDTGHKIHIGEASLPPMVFMDDAFGGFCLGRPHGEVCKVTPQQALPGPFSAGRSHPEPSRQSWEAGPPPLPALSATSPHPVPVLMFEPLSCQNTIQLTGRQKTGHKAKGQGCELPHGGSAESLRAL